MHKRIFATGARSKGSSLEKYSYRALKLCRHSHSCDQLEHWGHSHFCDQPWSTGDGLLGKFSDFAHLPSARGLPSILGLCATASHFSNAGVGMH